jgi:protein-S-isoprenylcysteine O-methyltransferase Ste14
VNALELKIPPPAVALALALLMWLTAGVAVSAQVSGGAHVAAALALLCIGQGISIAGMVAFRRAKTTVNPIKADKASSLVTQGVYRFTRNPMYLGLLLTLLAWAVYLRSPMAALWVIPYVLYINRFQIAPEERILLSLFGQAYTAYAARVRRWI